MTMRNRCTLTLLLLSFAGVCLAQKSETRISITDRSNVSSAEVGKALDSHCADVIVTTDPARADYLLEAIYTGAGPARKPYKLTLFNHDTDRVFSTETARIDSGVKDVCAFIRKRRL